MADQSRINDLRLRVERDPASIAFAQLAEEYRRAGQLDEAVQTCRTGLATHPEYSSARVTLGRALLASGRLQEANAELSYVLAQAPANLAAVRALAETCRRQGRLQDALTHYRSALALAPNDPDVDRVVRDLEHAVTDAANRVQDVARQRAVATLAELERWLEAIDATRAQRRA
jgi:tetratricopeptide (TPR) repeat protein